ncbi:MAG: alpha/beta fold hydrolase [Candidatus Pacebacteria bacterium]|nr:alpha/beta fold hydrolase [Candidatus Paceibacterota bacterium]
MTPAFVVQITTPKNFLLNGLWFGPKKPKQVLIWIHGLTSSMFSMHSVVQSLVNKNTAVVVFNNRGHDSVSKLKSTRGISYEAGSAHERFTDCVDDIQGAIDFVRKTGVKRIFLAGHSTGCQKAVYWASKKGAGVKGIVLLAPVSDYAGALKRHGAAKLSRIASYARKLVKSGKPNEFIPASLWPEELNDAQRFLSLYTPDSSEEIFTYIDPNKKPRALQKVKLPILVLWAQEDEFADRPASEATAWFEKHLKPSDTVLTVAGVGHGFKGGEGRVAKVVAEFMKER